MAITGRTLDKAAHTFCDRLNRLLNVTVTRARITPAREGRRVAIALREGGSPGAVLPTRYGRLVLSLQQLLDGERDGRKVKLRTIRYRYSLALDRTSEAFVRWDYCAAAEHGEALYCRHHLQGALPVRLPTGTTRLNDFHMPTGYVPVEDVLRFLIVDLEVPALHAGWDAVLKESSAEFRAQLRET
jgi:hypothetical protein